jgi:hypothetical protein
MELTRVVSYKGNTARIYRDAVRCEYVIRFFFKGIGYLPECDYHTDTWSDALLTANTELNLD